MRNTSTSTKVIIVTIVFIGFAPYLFTRDSFITGMDFRLTGPIGDTIGGITAPIIGVLNAFLLYITLRRQDEQIAQQDRQIARQEEELIRQNEQRSEDKFERLMDKKIGQVNNLVNNISIHFQPDKNELKQEFYQPHLGRMVLVVLPIMFDTETPRLSTFEISFLQFSTILTNISTAVVEAGFVLEKNYHSNFSPIEKQTNFEYVRFHISDIIDLYVQMENYANKYPQDEGLAKFKVRESLAFKSTIDAIEEFNPNYSE